MDTPVFKLEKVVHSRADEEMQDFEGPLDLILFLLSKNKMEIQDISISEILDQYLSWLSARKRMDLEVASEFVTMTALVAIEQGDLTSTVTVKRDATLAEGSSMYLREGERLTLETLLYGLLLCSGNDAAVAIADSVGGNQEKFVAMWCATDGFCTALFPASTAGIRWLFLNRWAFR